ncbi:MAG: phosphotransferase [Verrucomicrobia bacterium]|nr:phosphotransferase [Verrucomicrobiota bacterium]
MNIAVSDPFNAAADAALPTVAIALDPARAKSEFKRRLPKLSGDGRLRLKAIRVTRHKPGKRCVIEYDVEVDRPDLPKHALTLIGKIRAGRSGNEGFRQLETIWNSGFDAQSADGVSVPEPVGVIAEFKMWCQRKVPGETATRLLAGPDGVTLARRVADAIHKLHRASLPAERAHSMADELRILRGCLEKVSAQRPELAARVARVRAACEELGASVPAPNPCGIHRDFYPAQVIVDGARLWLIDFDLFCLGDPGLDVGNFLGHVTEQSLRERGRADALANVENALEERFVELSGETVRAAVQAYKTLTLARHIYLSTQFPERRHLTEDLVKLCEERLG